MEARQLVLLSGEIASIVTRILTGKKPSVEPVGANLPKVWCSGDPGTFTYLDGGGAWATLRGGGFHYISHVNQDSLGRAPAREA